ncbi:hypothetical protein TCAL_10785 [Tigriopus californicus]|uniref:SET domain-containing protein n=1 Tax=Tigriopus californicus TaxID=6832 RepID=A0A553NFQ5_TIGCA|nr:SET and MYND domain-containing protein 4-like [Tigriopus californicus]TRY64251.1 hypothetical protein TCAL_10785 [Tigriopus californicus]|eukprot:TCALIF_10785-PA protein Name:"Similar to Smyd4 SET and MYND domain-containing protein 4 (Mus musculus)" AED:0.10 eAED:0.10 QI:0/-1/0/1/-1/1/1/0/611
MEDSNFSRRFHFVPGGNQDSAIQELIFTAVEFVSDLGEFPRSKTIRDQIQYVSKHFRTNDLVLPIPQARKDFSKAKQAWELGQTGSIRAINEALRFCPRTQSLVCELYLKRAIISYQDGYYENAKEDLVEALLVLDAKNFILEPETVFRIHHKLAQCWSKLKIFSQAVRSLRTALVQLADCNFGQSEKSQFENMIQESIDKLSKKTDSKRKVSPREGLSLSDPKPDNPCLSQAIAIVNSSHKGRFAIADRKINCGEVIVIDEPVVSLMNPDDEKLMDDLCAHCLRQCSNFQHPCPRCSTTAFCSLECRSQSQLVHGFECKVNLNQIRLENTSDSFRVFLTWKAVIQIGLEEFKRLYRKVGRDLNEPENDQERMFQMMTHERERHIEAHIKYIIVALYLHKLLEKAGVCTSDRLDWELVEAIHHLLQVQDVNTHPILGLCDEGGRSSEVGLAKVGNAINVNIGSFINHSCNPNTCRINFGRKSVLVATRTIPTGQEISDIYSMHYSEIGRQERRNWLKSMFFFECSCEACEGHWPTYEELDTNGIEPNVMEDLKQVESGIFHALKRQDFDTAFQLHVKDVHILEKAVREPNRIYISVRNSLQFCLWKKYGHF